MAKLRATKWTHGDILRNGSPVWVQKTEDGWFAKFEDEAKKVMCVSGPWPTQDEAEFELLDGIDRISMGTEGE